MASGETRAAGSGYPHGLLGQSHGAHRVLAVAIRADFVGKNLPSSLWEDVSVNLTEKNGADEVVIEPETEE